MAQSNTEIARAAFETLSSGGVEEFLRFVDPEFVGIAPPELAVEPQTYRGHDGVRRWFDTFYEAVDELRLEPQEFIEAGDAVVVPLRIVVRGHGSGIEVGQDVTWVCGMRNGLVKRIDTYADKHAALEALGVKTER